jgi:hypothetical protein
MESVVSYCRFFFNNGDLDLIITNTSGYLYKYNKIE